MDMQAKNGSAEGAGMRGDVAKILRSDPGTLAQWCVLAGIEEWGISIERFTEELARCAEARFRGEKARAEELNAYVGALRLKDLGLACACAECGAGAWGHFFRVY